MMGGDKQKQSAGNNSQLMQANTINVYSGIDEKRAREICGEMYANARQEFTEDAYACANERVKKLENSLMPRIQEIEGALSAFADPAFQILLARAQREAAATERENDYDLLSELLVCHITKGHKRKNRAGIHRAIEIVDEIDDDALCALTVTFALEKFVPASGSCKLGLNALAGMFEKIMYTDLPSGKDWIEHLDILGAVRMDMLIPFQKTAEYYSRQLSGYSSAGIAIDSDDYKVALDALTEGKMGASYLVANELMDGYVRLPIVNKNAIETFAEQQNAAITDESIPKIGADGVAAMKTVWNLYSTDINVKEAANAAFMKEWDSYPSLKRLHDWWDAIPVAFDITQVGVILAHTNAKRCDKRIPELPLVE